MGHVRVFITTVSVVLSLPLTPCLGRLATVWESHLGQSPHQILSLRDSLLVPPVADLLSWLSLNLLVPAAHPSRVEGEALFLVNSVALECH